jgi:MFS family permease
MTLLVSLALGLACILFAGVTNLVALGLGFAALRFIGQGSLMLNCANVVSQWFHRRRGFALSLMAMGFALSMAVHPPLSQALVEAIGWRQAWLVLGLVTWVVLLPPVLLLLHDRPEAKGLQPDGGAVETAIQLGPKPVLADVGLTLAEALRTPAYYLVAAGMFAIAMLVTVLHFFQVSLFAAQGLSAQTASSVFAVSAMAMVLTMPGVGWLLDRLPTRVVFAGGLVVQALALVGATLVTDLPSALAYAVLFGLNNAVSMTLFGYMWARYFGRKHLGSVQGAGQTIQVVGASLGPPLIGFAVEFAGSFVLPLRVAALFPLACAVAVVLFLRTPKPLDAYIERD